jgi:hypothetical protein
MSVNALRFSIAYKCSGGHALTLGAFILRPDQSWEVVDSSGFGFSDWFSGPIGHDFHVSGTFSASRETVTGTLHSLLLQAGSRGRSDSWPLSLGASAVVAPFALPMPSQITLAQFQHIPTGITTAAVERRLGAPDDRDVFHPAGMIATTIPSGVPGSAQTWLDYAWRGHLFRYFQFSFRRDRIIARSLGRSLAGS